MLCVKKCVFVILITVVVLLSSITCANPLATEHLLIPGKPMACCHHEPYASQRQFPVIYCYAGHSKHLVNIWETVMLQIDLHPNQYDLYEGSSGQQVLEEFESLRSYWSFNFISLRGRDIKMDPFNSTCVGIRTDENYKLMLNVIRIDYWRVLMCVSGVILFFTAQRLSDNVFFYYLCGILLGMFACFLFLVYFVSKLLPFRRPLMYGVMAGGWTIGMYFFQIFWTNMRMVAVYYKSYVITYFTISGLISFLVCYWKGPVSNPRSKNIIKWTLQCMALALVFWSSHFQEASLALDFVVLAMYNLPFSWIKNLVYLCKRKIFAPKQKLLTEEEYHRQGVEETRKALNELRGYCSSPDCNQWKTVLKLKDPLRFRKHKRFAKFVEGSSHLNDDEILSFETESRKYMDDMLTDDSDEN